MPIDQTFQPKSPYVVDPPKVQPTPVDPVEAELLRLALIVDKRKKIT